MRHDFLEPGEDLFYDLANDRWVYIRTGEKILINTEDLPRNLRGVRADDSWGMYYLYLEIRERFDCKVSENKKNAMLGG